MFDLATGAGYIVGSDAHAEITIETATARCRGALRVADADATEGGDSAGFVVSRTGARRVALVVRFASPALPRRPGYVALGVQAIFPPDRRRGH